MPAACHRHAYQPAETSNPAARNLAPMAHPHASFGADRPVARERAVRRALLRAAVTCALAIHRGSHKAGGNARMPARARSSCSAHRSIIRERSRVSSVRMSARPRPRVRSMAPASEELERIRAKRVELYREFAQHQSVVQLEGPPELEEATWRVYHALGRLAHDVVLAIDNGDLKNVRDIIKNSEAEVREATANFVKEARLALEGTLQRRSLAQTPVKRYGHYELADKAGPARSLQAEKLAPDDPLWPS